jgi:two-component system, LytTR family, sensor kinase
LTTSPFSDTKVRAVFAVCWLLLTAFQVYALQAWGWRIALTESGFTSLLLAVFCSLLSNTLRFYRPEKEPAVYIFVWCLILAGLWLLIGYQFLRLLFGDQPAYLNFLQESLPIRFGLAFLLLGWVAMFSALWYNRQEQREQEQRKADAERLAREAELYKLRQQLHPHFLFNSLNSISALIGSRPAEARKMIHQLSDFLRGTLKKEEEQWVSLTEELAHLQLYLDIEKVRFGHRLSTCIECDEFCGGRQLPSMLLQPVVENAIKFGLYDTIGTVTISIRAFLEDNLLIISVQNPFDPQTSRPNKGAGFGLSGVQRRLYLLFARNDLLQTRADGELFTTTLKIPQHETSLNY